MLIYSPAIIHLANVDELLAPAYCDLFRVWLAHERLERRLDAVHRIASARHLCSKVVDTGRSAHFEDTVGDA